MKICIPATTGDSQTAAVHEHFGSAPYFMIYDTQTGSFETLANDNRHHAHGACQPLRALAGRTVDAVITGGMGFRAVRQLNESGIKAYRSLPGTVLEIARNFTNGELEEITADNACSGHGCH